MKTAAFRHVRAETVEQALGALGSDEDARVLAGGQSLVPIMALRLSTPSLLVDITRCTELRSHGWNGPDLTVGAAVTDRVLERDPEVRSGHPLLARTLSLIAHPEIRARGTLCGSLAHADPAAELPALLLASDGHVLVRGPEDFRSVPAEDFFTGPFSPALEPGEMVVGARLPAPGHASGWSVEEISRRRGDFAIVGVVCVLDVGDDDRCSRARLSLFGVASTPVRARLTEQLLVGSDLQDDALDAAAAVCFDGVEVLGDEVHASAAYRRRAGTALVRRALASAARLATGSRHD
jgi:CO/xanthine dehydrogenase FAD-binding subunit